MGDITPGMKCLYRAKIGGERVLIDVMICSAPYLRNYGQNRKAWYADAFGYGWKGSVAGQATDRQGCVRQKHLSLIKPPLTPPASGRHFDAGGIERRCGAMFQRVFTTIRDIIMKIKSVTDHLDKAFDNFISYFDEKFKLILREKSYFAGGCVYCLANNKPVKDYDIFLTDNGVCEEISKLDLWKCKTEYALSRGLFQLVTKYYGEPEFCVGQFDFKHNMFFYRPYSDEIQSACGEFESLFTNKLIFNENRARDIEGVYLRIARFAKRGFIVDPELIVNIKKRTTSKNIKKYARKLKRRSYRDIY